MLMSIIPQCIILEIPDRLSQWLHVWFWLSISGNSSEKLPCWNIVNMPYCCKISMQHLGLTKVECSVYLLRQEYFWFSEFDLSIVGLNSTTTALKQIFNDQIRSPALDSIHQKDTTDNLSPNWLIAIELWTILWLTVWIL